MPKEEWGVKRVCPGTGKRFFDLNRSPIVSPYTGEIVEVDAGKRSMIAANPDAQSSKPSEKSKFENEEVILDDDVDIDIEDELLEEDDDDENVSLDEIADMPENEDDS